MLFVIFLFAALFSSAFPAIVPQEIKDAFVAFKIDYDRHYTTSVEEKYRLNCFHDSWRRIQQLNQRESQAGGSATYGINKFADWCEKEISGLFGTRRSVTNNIDQHPLFSSEEVARAEEDPIDWRDKEAVTAVKDQGVCGSCWAFSSTGAIEGAWVVAGNKLVSLSEQELIDCTFVTATGGCPGGTTQNVACQGGNMKDTLDWVVKNRGINSEANQPYLDHDVGPVRLCNATGCLVRAATISKVQTIAENEGQINAALHKYGPLSIGVFASSSMVHYTGGIMTGCMSWPVNHGVVLVGYGNVGNISKSDGASPYWIIKNSWGGKWGEEGFFRLEYGTNQCDITTMVNAAIV